jgi:hypothetical protein
LRTLFGAVTLSAAVMGLVRYLVVSDLAAFVLTACLLSYPGFALSCALAVLGSGVGQRICATTAAVSGAMVVHASIWFLTSSGDSEPSQFYAKILPFSAILLAMGVAAIVWIIWHDDGGATAPSLEGLLKVKRELRRPRGE